MKHMKEFLSKFFKKDGKEVSKGGSEIYRYDEPEDHGWRPPENYCQYTEEVCTHFDQIFPDRQTSVFHEIISDLIHIDVHIMRPTAEEDFYVIYTTGMSDMPMTVPEDMPSAQDYSRAELVMFLPGTWDVDNVLKMEGEIPNKDFWAISGIKFFARFPHDFNTWLGSGHTIPNGPDYEPIVQGSEMGGVVLLELGEKESPVVARDGTKITLLMVVPISQAETEYKLEYGMDALLEKFDECGVPHVLDIYRKSVV